MAGVSAWGVRCVWCGVSVQRAWVSVHGVVEHPLGMYGARVHHMGCVCVEYRESVSCEGEHPWSAG